MRIVAGHALRASWKRSGAECIAILGLLCALLGGSLAWLARAADAPDPSFAAWRVPDPDLHGVAARGDRVWVVGAWGTALWSDDGGERFHTATTPTRETLLAVSFADAEHGWAVGAHGALLRSQDGGRSWELQKAEREGEPVTSSLLAVSAVSPGEAWAVGDLGLVLHTGDGSSWRARMLPEASFGDENVADRILNAVHFSSPERGCIAGEFRTLLRTEDGGQTWAAARDAGGAVPELYLFQLDGDAASLAAVGLEGSVLLSSDGGAAWEARPVKTRAGLYAVAWSGANGLVAGDGGALFATADAGLSWRELRVPGLFSWLGSAAFGAPGRAYVVGEHGVLLRSRDGARSFERVALERPS